MDEELLHRYIKALDEIKELRTILDKTIRKEIEKGIKYHVDVDELMSDYLKKLSDERTKRIISVRLKKELYKIKKRSSFRQMKIDDFPSRND